MKKCMCWCLSIIEYLCAFCYHYCRYLSVYMQFRVKIPIIKFVCRHNVILTYTSMVRWELGQKSNEPNPSRGLRENQSYSIRQNLWDATYFIKGRVVYLSVSGNTNVRNIINVGLINSLRYVVNVGYRCCIQTRKLTIMTEQQNKDSEKARLDV